MYRTLATTCILALSCGDGSARETPAQTRPVQRVLAHDAAPSPLAKPSLAKPSLPRPPKLTGPQRLARDLDRYRALRKIQRKAVRKVKTGRPLGRTKAGRLAYETFVRMHADTTMNITALRRVIYAELAAAETAIKDRLASLPEKTSRRDVRDTRPHAAIARAAQSRAVSATPFAFTKKPPPQRIKTIRSATSPLAFYTERAVYLNLHRSNRPPAHLVEAIIFHETIPGHHLENRLGSAKVARTGDKPGDQEEFNAFIEGWGLYAEQLAADLQLYSNDAARLGRFELRAWRAARAAVDIGLHHEGWTMDRARKFMTEHTVLSPSTIRVEIQRVLTRPGRVQAYVVGARTILELRAQAKKRLGPLFSLREFHSVLLGSGRIPLSTVTRLVTEWIAKIRRDQTA